jgi:hypothetical protein
MVIVVDSILGLGGTRARLMPGLLGSSGSEGNDT